MLLFGGLAVVNVRGVRQGARVAVAATVAKLLPLLLLVAVGIFAIQRENLAWPGWPSLEQLGAGTLLLFFAFAGVESALTPSGEIRDPARTVPRAVLGATVAIVLLYLALQVVAQGVLGNELALGSATPLADVAQRLAGTTGRRVVAACTAVAGFGLLAADMIGSPRAFLVASERGMLPRALSRVFLKYRPTWSPDGRSVMYFADPGNNNASLFQKRADGSGAAEKLLGSDHAMAEALWSRDGQWLVVRTTLPSRDILGFRPGVDDVPVPLVASPKFDERAPTLSPDGKWIAYQSDETGKSEIYVRPFPKADEGRWQISTGGGDEPLWSRSGREIFFRGTSGEMMTVPVTTAPTFSAGAPVPMFQAKSYARAASYRAYDVSPDDKRFVMLRPVTDSVPTPPNQMVFVDNWFEELKTKVKQ